MKVVLVLLLIVAACGAVLVALAVQPFTGSAPPWRGPHADAKRLESLVRALIALGPRHDAAGQARAAEWVRARLGAFPVTEQTYEVNGATFRNLIVRLGPASGERVVVGAHYDARGPYPGADDNASGTAALIEIARVLAAHPPPVATELVWYSNEEYGLLGSARHADAAAGVRAMISLEMLGCFDQPQHFPFAALRLLYRRRGDYIVVVGRLQDFPLVRSVKRALRSGGIGVASIDAPEAIPGIGNSDHSSYWRAGIRAVMVTDTAWYRNLRYHTARDTPDTLDYAKMAQVVDGIAAWVSSR